jgi:glutathione S-transferase
VSDRVTLYACAHHERFVGAGHACARALHALRRAGYEVDVLEVEGHGLMPWKRKGPARDEVKNLTGQDKVPVLLLPEGNVIAGSDAIVRWADDYPVGA